MGLFSKNPQVPDYDVADCEAKKKRMREIFNEAVENGKENNSFQNSRSKNAI